MFNVLTPIKIIVPVGKVALFQQVSLLKRNYLCSIICKCFVNTFKQLFNNVFRKILTITLILFRGSFHLRTFDEFLNDPKKAHPLK